MFTPEEITDLCYPFFYCYAHVIFERVYRGHEERECAYSALEVHQKVLTPEQALLDSGSCCQNVGVVAEFLKWFLGSGTVLQVNHTHFTRYQKIKSSILSPNPEE